MVLVAPPGRARRLSLAGSALGALALAAVWLLAVLVPLPVQYFAGAVAVLIVVALAWQLACIRLLRARWRSDRQQLQQRATSADARSVDLAARSAAAERLAEERLNLLRMVTHEVRQSLNNAQAVLQSAVSQSSAEPQSPTGPARMAGRVQAVLDDVILALSNSVLAASIIEWKDAPALTTVGAGEVMAMAMMDCPETGRSRVIVQQPDEEIHLDADPVLLRLALRNLLSNALKYSPAGTPVQVEIALDEERLGVAFRVGNAVPDGRLLEGDLFARDKRGAGAAHEGFGLGLFMVGETARMHHGMLSVWQGSPRDVTFELFLPL